MNFKFGNILKIIKQTLFLLCCLAIVLLVASLTKNAKTYLSFDYDSVRKDGTVTWGGPKEGETVNLTMLRNERAESIPADKPLILLLLVDPRCQMCRESADLFEQVQLDATSHGIEFLVASFGGPSSREEFFGYARTLCDSSHAFYWDGEKGLVSPAVQQMAVPSFLLLNQRGLVLRRFPGGSKDSVIRSRMAAQIIAETLHEKVSLP